MKYILLMTQDSEEATDHIIQWLQHLSDFRVIRITEKSKIKTITIEAFSQVSSKFSIHLGDDIVESENILAYYYRRGRFQYNNVHPVENVDNPLYDSLFTSVNKYYAEEWEHAVSYIHYLLKSNTIPSLNSFFDLEVNKLTNIEIARKSGLNTPTGIISNDVNIIKKFIIKKRKGNCKGVEKFRQLF